MTIRALAPRDIQTTLNYYTPLDTAQPPYNYVNPLRGGIEPPTGVPKTNVGDEVHPVTVRDARRLPAHEFDLDVTGFQFIRYPSIEKEFADDDRIKTIYFAEVEELLKKYTGAKRVFIFNHVIRKSAYDARCRGKPLHNVHVDRTPTATVELVKTHFGDEAERLLKCRYRMVNVWRPIANTITHDPLALADYRSVDPDNDLVPSRQIRVDSDYLVFRVKHNPAHEWYYLSDHTPDEVTLIKIFDSDLDQARFSPHSAFFDSTCPADAPERQSIEVRALLFDIE